LLATLRAGEQPALLEERVDLDAVTRAVVDDAALLAIRDKKQIEFIGPPDAVEVSGNGAAIAAVVGNLIDNALRAEPEGGEVIVRIGDDAAVSITDHGPDILDEEKQMIFEPFWRKSEATPGAGLGLAIAKDLVEKLRGRIFVEETPGGGATFKVSFLLARALSDRTDSFDRSEFAPTKEAPSDPTGSDGALDPTERSPSRLSRAGRRRRGASHRPSRRRAGRRRSS
jgi:signal transduction histidine kinase